MIVGDIACERVVVVVLMVGNVDGFCLLRIMLPTIHNLFRSHPIRIKGVTASLGSSQAALSHSPAQFLTLSLSAKSTHDPIKNSIPSLRTLPHLHLSPRFQPPLRRQQPKQDPLDSRLLCNLIRLRAQPWNFFQYLFILN